MPYPRLPAPCRETTLGEPARVRVNLTCVAVEECVEDRRARDAIRAQPVQVRVRKPCRGNKFRSRAQRITVTVQPIERVLRRIGSGTSISGIRSGRSTDAVGLTLVVQLHLLSKFGRRHRAECATVGYSTVTDLARLRGCRRRSLGRGRIPAVGSWTAAAARALTPPVFRSGGRRTGAPSRGLPRR